MTPSQKDEMERGIMVIGLIGLTLVFIALIWIFGGYGLLGCGVLMMGLAILTGRRLKKRREAGEL